MRFNYLRVGPAAIFRLIGDLAAGADCGALRASIGRMFEPAIRGVFLDMTHVPRLDCTGIGTLIELWQRAHASGRAFGLVNVEPRQQRMLDMVGLSAVLGIHDGDQAAIATVRDLEPAIDRTLALPRLVFSAPAGLALDRRRQLAVV